jgi:hypothetical protein
MKCLDTIARYLFFVLIMDLSLEAHPVSSVQFDFIELNECDLPGILFFQFCDQLQQVTEGISA